MCGFHVPVHAGTQSESHVRALVVHGTLAVETDESTLCVHAVERPLGTAQNIHTRSLIGVEVHLALAHHGQPVNIHTNSGTVHTRTNAAHVHGRSITRTIMRHDKRWGVEGEITQVADVESLEVVSVEHTAAHWLESQPELLSGLCHHNHFVHVHHTARVGF